MTSPPQDKGGGGGFGKYNQMIRWDRVKDKGKKERKAQNHYKSNQTISCVY